MQRHIHRKISSRELERYEYCILADMLDIVDSALRGNCDDIDCAKYVYKYTLKKKYKPVLEHGFSCMENLKWRKEALLRLLSLRKFRKFRYKRCKVCKEQVDSLSDKSAIVSFTRPGEIGSELKTIIVHRKCEKKVNAPKGWKKGW